jgi:acylphosphatase
MSKVRVHAFVSGMVQGVNFRSNTTRFAKSLGITGWVRNLDDGRVEVVAEGERDKIDKLIEFLKNGPPFSRVDELDLKKEEYKGEFRDFSILY